MPQYQAWQLRSGEGAVLTRFSHLGPASLPDVLPEIFADRILLVAGDDLPPGGPEGAERVAEGLWALEGEAALRFARGHGAWARRRLFWALVDRLPEPDVRTRCIPDALRPWDHERLAAAAYGQSGRRHAHQGVWFRDEADRRRWIEAAVARLLATAGLELPAGDATLVLELPTDGTFEARFRARGRGDSFRLSREFPAQGLEREWRVERGEWLGEETRRGSRSAKPLRARCVQGLATAGIFLVSLPVSVFVLLVLLSTKLTDVSTTARKT